MIRLDRRQKISDKKLFVTIFLVTFVIFFMTNDGHRSTFDEDTPAQQALRMSTMTPHPHFVEGESRLYFEYERFKGNSDAVLCKDGIFCTNASIIHSATQVPFIMLNQHLGIISHSDIFFPASWSEDRHYVWWRNSISADLTFMEMFYGPLLTSLSVGFLFLIARSYNFTLRISISLAMFCVKD